MKTDEMLEDVLKEMRGCENLPGRLAASFVRFAFHVGTLSQQQQPSSPPPRIVAPIVAETPTRDEEKTPRKKYTHRAPMTEERKAVLRANLAKAREKRGVAGGDGFRGNGVVDGVGVAVEEMPANSGSDHQTNDADDSQTGAIADETVGR